MTRGEIKKIIEENLDEKSEKLVKTIEKCEDCRFYDDPWIWGSKLHCCCQDSGDPKTSRDVMDLYNNCPIGHEIKVTKSYIKKYGIIHREPEEDYYCDNSGSIAIVDFSGTTFESDGHNPDVRWKSVVVFFYDTEEECDIMMELALDYYNRFNLNAPYVPKICYG